MIYVIGDVHGKYKEYRKLISQFEYSVQVGDFGFDYQTLGSVDSSKHKFLGGNHEKWPVLLNYPPKHFLGRYGAYTLNGVKFFFVSGGKSIDDISRRLQFINGGPTSWYYQEELLFNEMLDCYNLYKEEKPDILLSHTPPRDIINKVCGVGLVKKFGLGGDFTCQTSSFIQSLFEAHQPNTAVFGHLHKTYDYDFMGCKCHGLEELGVLRIENE